jgi:tripartite-type tricarboxylate transporter receptor subunit TctC
MATTGVMAINNSLYKNMTYDAAKDLEPVLFVASITNVLIVPPDFPAKNVSELIALAKKEPGKLAFASSGAGASTHMSAELFKAMTGTDILHVPYKGSGQAMPDLMSGRVQMMFENAPGAVSHIKAGKLRALAQTGLKRSPAMPDVPTVDESGVKGYESLSWSGIAVAAGTPRPVIERLNKDLNTVLAAPEMRQKIEEQGAEVIGGTPEAFRKHVDAEREKWSRLIRSNNIVVN